MDQFRTYTPEYRVRALMEAFGRMLMEQRVYRGIFGVI